MPRKKLIRTEEFYYHVTTRSNNKEWFSIPLEEVWEIVIDSFDVAQERAPANVSQFVLMANHYHFLIRTPNADIDRFMYFFNKTFSSELQRKSGSSNRMFGSNYKWSLIQSPKYFANVFRYIYQNPLRAELVDKCEDYPYSTYHYSCYQKKLPFPFVRINHLENDPAFINEKLESKKQEGIKRGLKKSVFREVRQRNY